MTDDLKEIAVELKRRGISPGYFKDQRRRGMSIEEIWAAWPRRPLSNRVGTRRFRRRLVVGTYASWVLIAVIERLITLPSPGWVKPGLWIAMGLVFFNSLVGILWLSRRTYINSPALGDAELDERLVQIRNRAYPQGVSGVRPAGRDLPSADLGGRHVATERPGLLQCLHHLLRNRATRDHTAYSHRGLERAGSHRTRTVADLVQRRLPSTRPPDPKARCNNNESNDDLH